LAKKRMFLRVSTANSRYLYLIYRYISLPLSLSVSLSVSLSFSLFLRRTLLTPQGLTSETQAQLEGKQRELMPLSKAVCDAQSKLAVSEEELNLHCNKARTHQAQLAESKANLAKVVLF
jgi:hypothetical protein